MLHLPRGKSVRQQVNPARINLPEAMGKLRNGKFTGYLRFDAPQGSGVMLFQGGKLISAVFFSADDAPRQIAYDAIARMFEVSIQGDARLNIYHVSADLVVGLHALLQGRYLQQQEDLQQLDIAAMLRRIEDERLSACLRVHAAGRTTLIFYDCGYALGFFLEGATELQQTVDLSTSVAAIDGARLDLIEIQSADQIVLADLMGSADLSPIWQRARKLLMEERRKQEEAQIRTQERSEDRRRELLLAVFKTIAANHIGKFGIAQVEKAAPAIGHELKPGDIEAFLVELTRLAQLVAGRDKVTAMIAEMRKRYRQNL